MTKPYALCGTTDAAMALTDEVIFLQAIRAPLVKGDGIGNVRARLRTMIKALLKCYKYPPDQEAAAVELVLEQTEMIAEEWAREDLGDRIQAVMADGLRHAVGSQPAPGFR